MSRAHAIPRRNRRIAIAVVGLLGAGALTWFLTTFAGADTGDQSTAGARTVVCPVPEIGAVPAAARAE
ncbi:hypothetical protein, partial [Actinophytocola xanthii]|uniref:hypothetical protein n=1 Tax=Actinophytocola xanthii TaxID=1912961 RepID=UPI001E35FDF6